MRLVAIDLTGRDAELVGDRCWQAGASGLWEVDASTLRVGVEDERVTDFLELLADLGPRDVTDVEAVELAGRAASIPFAGTSIELWVPATVFGDGAHPTTASCLAALTGRVDAGHRVLDVGCGAGALTIAAALLGGRVTAIDLDPGARTATADNAARNGVAVEVSARLLSEIAGPFDIVVANMTSGALGPLIDDLVRCTIPGGTLVVSGMLEEQWPAVRDAAGGTVREVRTVDGWLTAVVSP